MPLTGDLSDYGPSGRKAAELAVDQINAAAKEAGADHTVKVVHEDDQTDPQAAVQAARKVVDSDNASCIAGGYSSTSSTIPIAQLGHDPRRRAGVLAGIDRRRDLRSRRTTA